MITVRKMELSEVKEVKKTAAKAFAGGIERFFVSSPKDAMVAVEDNKIVGGIYLKYIISNGTKIGYFDAAFIDPDYQGQGVGGALYEKTVSYFWEQGCTALTATVKDDNVGSWKLFLNNGFVQTGLTEAIRKLGFKAMLLQYFTTPVCCCNGMEFYLAMKDAPVMPKKSTSPKQIGLYVLANILLMLPALLFNSVGFLKLICSYTAILLGGVLFGYLGSLLSRKQWTFRLNSCGAVIVAFINFISGVYPLIGGWYPEKYENTEEFRRSMGIIALFEWVFIMVITVLAFLLQTKYTFLNFIPTLGCIFLLYRIIAVYPFESYGGARVYRWNKGIYGISAVISIAIIMLRNLI